MCTLFNNLLRYFHTQASNTLRKLKEEATRVGSTFQVSVNNRSVLDYIHHLEIQMRRSSSDKHIAEMSSFINLIHELKVWKYLPLPETYDEYLAKLPIQYHPKYAMKHDAIGDFVRRLLSDSGIHCIIINVDTCTRYVMLRGKCGDTDMVTKFRNLDQILSRRGVDNNNDAAIGHISRVLPLLTTARDRAVGLCCLSLIFSGTQLRHMFGLHEDVISSTKEKVLKFTEEKDQTEIMCLQQGQDNITMTIKTLESRISEKENSLSKKRDRLHEVEVENQEQDLKNIKERLHKLRTKPNLVKRFAARQVQKWKKTLFTQSGKG